MQRIVYNLSKQKLSSPFRLVKRDHKVSKEERATNVEQARPIYMSYSYHTFGKRSLSKTAINDINRPW